MRRVGVMGGTFDPIHHGHLVAASEVGHRFALDDVVFVPTGQPWQKADQLVSSAEDRYLMTVIATASNPRFSVSRADIERGGPTYTIDTLRDLRKSWPDAELFFITGADALTQILSWRSIDETFELAHFIGCTRPGHRLDASHLPDGKFTLVEVPALAISSTEVRHRVAHDEPVWYLVPEGIVQYIHKRNLYRGRHEHPHEYDPAEIERSAGADNGPGNGSGDGATTWSGPLGPVHGGDGGDPYGEQHR